MLYLAERCADLRLQVADDDQIWYGDGDQPAVASGLASREFLSQPLLRGAPCVRLLGLPQNADLICHLFRARLHDPAWAARSRLELGSPSPCGFRTDRARPEVTLQQMRHLAGSPSQGGWHAMTEVDFPAYCLVAEQRLAPGRLTETARRALHAHPAWPALSFLPTVDEPAAAQLLAEIIDPRWFADPARPERLSRLRSYLGLQEWNIRQTPAEAAASGKHVRRAWLVWRAWSSDQAPEYHDIRHDPRHFLWRVYCGVDAPHKARLRASQKFLEFLRLVWLSRLSRRAPGHELFLPEYYFRRTDEIAAYQEHWARVQRTLL